VSGSLDLSHGYKTRSEFHHSVSDERGSFSFTLSSQNGRFGLLFTLRDDELGAFGSLLGDLFLLNGRCEISGELQISDSNVIKDNVEFKGAFAKIFTDLPGDLLSLSDELLGVVLSDDGLEHLIGDGWENTLVVIDTSVVVDLGELILLGSEQKSQSDVNILEILSTG